jgi:hypothetical protein
MLVSEKNEDDTMTQPILQHFGQVIHHDEPQLRPRNSGQGRCTLLATGPGESHLLSASAISAIQAATMLLVDDRVSASVVALAMPGARVIHIDRRSGGLATPQAFVQNLILMAVREGEQVVHLQVSDRLATNQDSEKRSLQQTVGVNAGSLSDRPRVRQASLSLKMSQNLHNSGPSNRF